MSLLWFKNREREGVGEVVSTSLGWPVVLLADGEKTALNPALNETRIATTDETAAYWAERMGDY